MQEESINLTGFNDSHHVLTVGMEELREGHPVRYRVCLSGDGEAYSPLLIDLPVAQAVNLNPPTSHIGLAALERNIDPLTFKTDSQLNAIRMQLLWAGYGLAVDWLYTQESEYQVILKTLNIRELSSNPQTILSPTGEPFVVGRERSESGYNCVVVARQGKLGDTINLTTLNDVLSPVVDEQKYGPLLIGQLDRVQDAEIFDFGSQLFNHKTNKVTRISPSERAVFESLFRGIPFETYFGLIKGGINELSRA